MEMPSSTLLDAIQACFAVPNYDVPLPLVMRFGYGWRRGMKLRALLRDMPKRYTPYAAQRMQEMIDRLRRGQSE
jgi:hypothetical protein